MTTLMKRGASSFNKVAEFGYWLSQFVDFVPSDEYRLVIRNSVAGGMCFGYGDGSAALYATMDDSHEQCASHEFDKEHVEYIVHCEGVPCGGEDSCQGDSAVPLSIRNAQGRKVWIDATICELGRLTSTLI
jgi:hypothetical protein